MDYLVGEYRRIRGESGSAHVCYGILRFSSYLGPRLPVGNPIISSMLGDYL